MKKYDVLVIGSGGGTKLATPSAQLGYKAAIIEKDQWGGTCLNRGCIPSKMLIHPANVASAIKEAEKYGIHASIKKVDFAKLITRINNEISADSQGIPRWYDKQKNLDYYHGTAKFVSDKVVEVNGKKVTAKNIFIATGSRPLIPNIPGLKNTPYMTSTEALKNTRLPKKLLVIGGGYIGCELGHAYAALGSDVQFIVRGDGLLKREDSEVSEAFTQQFSKQYNVHLRANTKQVSYNKKTKKFTITITKPQGTKKVVGDALLVATGVVPNSDTAGLENTSIKKTSRGFIKVNKHMQTAVPGVYALGDVVGNYLFRHSVNFEGEFLFNTLIKQKKSKPIKYPPMPHAVFSHPEIGSVGKTEQELQKEKVPHVVGLNMYKSSAQGMARLPETGFVKLLFHKKTKKLLGAHIIGEESATMIHHVIHAITYGATLDNLLNIIYIHPALPEIVRNACRKAKEAFEEK
jgi:mycothione reductase